MEKGAIVFLPVPDSLKDEIHQFSHRQNYEDEEQGEGGGNIPFSAEFQVDPSIPLPMELAPGETIADPEKLSWEMILSGMLRIISVIGRHSALEIPAAGRRQTVKSGDFVKDIEKARIPPEWIDYYRRFILTVKPEIYHEFTGASIVKARNEEFDMALEISEVLEGLFPGSPGVLLNRALILEQRAAALEKNGHAAVKENAEALAAYETALSMEPVLPDTLFNAGFFFMQQREFGRAKDCFTRYVEAADGEGGPGEIPLEKKEQAEKIIRDIHDHSLDDESFREAYDYISRGNDEKGLSKIREFIEKHPRIWNGWFILGWALRKTNRYADSLESFKKALELGGSGIDLKNEMAICLMELGDLSGARKKLEEALREEPENIKIISNLGVLAMRSGSREEALAFFRTVLELDPGDPLAKHFLEEG